MPRSVYTALAQGTEWSLLSDSQRLRWLRDQKYYVRKPCGQTLLQVPTKDAVACRTFCSARGVHRALNTQNGVHSHHLRNAAVLAHATGRISTEDRDKYTRLNSRAAHLKHQPDIDSVVKKSTAFAVSLNDRTSFPALAVSTPGAPTTQEGSGVVNSDSLGSDAQQDCLLLAPSSGLELAKAISLLSSLLEKMLNGKATDLVSKACAGAACAETLHEEDDPSTVDSDSCLADEVEAMRDELGQCMSMASRCVSRSEFGDMKANLMTHMEANAQQLTTSVEDHIVSNTERITQHFQQLDNSFGNRVGHVQSRCEELQQRIDEQCSEILKLTAQLQSFSQDGDNQLKRMETRIQSGIDSLVDTWYESHVKVDERLRQLESTRADGPANASMLPKAPAHDLNEFVGKTVSIEGLTKAPELNGKIADVLGIDDSSQRLILGIEGRTGSVKVKVGNVKWPAECFHCGAEVTSGRCYACSQSSTKLSANVTLNPFANLFEVPFAEGKPSSFEDKCFVAEHKNQRSQIRF